MGEAGDWLDAGVLDGRIGPKVSSIFGLHGWPGIKIGTVASKPGVLLAATDGFKARFVVGVAMARTLILDVTRSCVPLRRC